VVVLDYILYEGTGIDISYMASEHIAARQALSFSLVNSIWHVEFICVVFPVLLTLKKSDWDNQMVCSGLS
jgi:hypothetical protein